MAPSPPMGRDAAIERVAADRLPFAMGSPHPIAMVLEQDGRFRIRALVVPDFRPEPGAPLTPESFYARGESTGVIHVDVATRDDLLATMRQMPWPPEW